MRLIFVAAVAMLTAWSPSAPAMSQTLFRPVAVVNDSAITGFDLAQRAQILLALGYPPTDPDALRADALDQLVEDRLKLQAGEEIGITPTQEMVEVGVEEFARSAGMSAGEFRALLSSQGVTDQALADMVTAELVWLQVIRLRFGNRVEPGEAEIDAEMELPQRGDATELRILEIGLPVTADGRTEAETRALAEQLYTTLSQGGDFRAAVARYSKSPSAAREGEVGWVTTERMPAELQRELSDLEVGEVSRPLPVSGGFSILKVVDRRQGGEVPPADTTDAATREEVRTRLINQRTARLAEGLLQEMRRDALIEVR